MFDLVCAQCNQEPHNVIHIALCVVVSRSNTICASTLKYVLVTHRTTCAAHCNCCWFITEHNGVFT